MAKDMLPKQIDPFQLANNETTLEGDLPLLEMVRLSDLLSDESGLAQITLQFGRDELKYAFIKGSIKTKFKVVCQRCNQPMPMELDIPVDVSLVRNDKEARRLPGQCEPLLVTGDTMSLTAMVEEEILLSIPIVPRHSLKGCYVKPSDFTEWEEEEDVAHPFSKLKKLLRE